MKSDKMSHVAFVGDSRSRYLFDKARRELTQSTAFIGHDDSYFESKEFNFFGTFLWTPYLDKDIFEVLFPTIIFKALLTALKGHYFALVTQC